MIEKEVIIQMLQIEKDACQIIEETKEKANKLLGQARHNARRLAMEHRNRSCKPNFRKKILN